MPIRIIAAILFFMWAVSPGLTQTTSFPSIDECEGITLRASQRWWLQVRVDGSGAYGFGALPARVAVRERTFDFKQIYQDSKYAVVEQRQDAEASYVAVSCHEKGSSAAREFYLLDQVPALVLLHKARKNSMKPGNEIEERQKKQIDDFWKRNPPPFPDNPDAGAGK
jgi:hypothetical protein